MEYMNLSALNLLMIYKFSLVMFQVFKKLSKENLK